MKNILTSIMGIDPSTINTTGFVACATGEVVLGTIPDEICKWYGYREQVAAAYNAAAPALLTERKAYVEEFEGLHEGIKDCEGKCDAVRAKIKGVEAQLSALHEPLEKVGDNFWNLVRLEFNIPDGTNLGIRKGWQLVSLPKEPREEVFEVLFGDEGGSDLLSNLISPTMLFVRLFGGVARREKRKPAEAPAGAPSAS